MMNKRKCMDTWLLEYSKNNNTSYIYLYCIKKPLNIFILRFYVTWWNIIFKSWYTFRSCSSRLVSCRFKSICLRVGLFMECSSWKFLYLFLFFFFHVQARLQRKKKTITSDNNFNSGTDNYNFLKLNFKDSSGNYFLISYPVSWISKLIVFYVIMRDRRFYKKHKILKML